jgi:hypothetical protein
LWGAGVELRFLGHGARACFDGWDEEGKRVRRVGRGYLSGSKLIMVEMMTLLILGNF